MGFFLYGFKIIALWSVASSALLADVVVFDQSTLFGSLGAIVIIVGTIWMTFRANAVKLWKETAEARAQRISALEVDLQHKSDEKHAAISQLAAEKLKTDLTPVLESLVRMQESMQERRQDQHDIAEALTTLSEGQLQIAAGQSETNAVLTKIVEQLEILSAGR